MVEGNIVVTTESIFSQSNQTVNRRSSWLEAEYIMKTWKYVAVVLFNLAISVLCEPEDPLDRGTVKL